MKEQHTIYEYKSVNVQKNLEQTYIDCYKNFGWIHINNEKRNYYINDIDDFNIVEIKFKRDRKIKNKEQLNKLQKDCENAFIAINKLERMPQAIATARALSIGFIALIFIALSVFLAIKNIWWGTILSGIIGLVGCSLSYPTYQKTITEKEEKNKAKIDEQYDKIYNSYEQARKILSEME